MGITQSGRAVPQEQRERDGVIEPLLRADALGAEGLYAEDTRAREDVQELPRDALGRLVINVLHTMLPGRLEEVQTPRVSGLIQRLRRRLLVTIICTVLAAPIAVWLLVWGVSTYVATETPECNGSLRVWLLGFLVLQLAWPICMPSLTLLLLGWCIAGLVLLPQPLHCPKLHSFLVEALALQSVQAGLLVGAAVSALTARPMVQQLGQMVQQSGTDPDVIGLIATLPPDQVPSDAECVICLSRDDEEGVPWRVLVCGHRFHEPCLLEWLMKARRCPVCRMDLHVAYEVDQRNNAVGNP
jgi:hypothetical protein